MIAVVLLARHIAESLQLDSATPLTEICRLTGASRPSVYEQKRRLLAALDELATARPGRPARAETRGQDEVVSLKLTIAVLEYRDQHPGAVVSHQQRSSYSPAFQRFVLARFDQWVGTQESFAASVRIPLDTLRDWLQRQRELSTAEPQPPQIPQVPVDASQLVRQIAELWEGWQGPTRAFLRWAVPRLGITRPQLVRVLRLLGVISARSAKPFRHRGATRRLSPGSLLVTDGKRVDVALSGSGRWCHFNWQGMVEQTTGCHTAAVVSDEEDSSAACQAFDESLATLGGLVPEAVLHDNKPCYLDRRFQAHVREAGASLIPATESRPENKAILEGAFGLWTQRIGTIELDDTSSQSLIRCAVREVIRAYLTGIDSVPHLQWGGRSRRQVLLEACPSQQQRLRDREFLARLQADHDRSRRSLRKRNPVSRKLLDEVFQRLALEQNDPQGKLRDYLATHAPAAVRRGAAIVAAKLERRAIQPRHAHRYLTKVIRTQQHELDLERAAQELEALSRAEQQIWTHREHQDYQQLLAEHPDPAECACAVAERAAHGGLPLQGLFWSRKLLEILAAAPHLAVTVRSHLIRLHEAPVQERLALLDRLTAQEHAIAPPNELGQDLS